MKLVRIDDDLWVNPDHVSCIWIDMQKIPDSREYRYPVMVTCTDRTQCIGVYDTWKEANVVLFRTVRQLHMNANGNPEGESE